MVKKTKEKRKANKKGMVNITINIPEIYDKNIQKLIKMKVIPSRSEGIRIALREFLHEEYKTLKLLGFFENENEKPEKMPFGRISGEPNLRTKVSDLETKLKGKDNMINYLKAELEKHEKGINND